MALEKILTKLQQQINEIVPTLELFVEDTVQPSVNDCEALQQQLYLLNENLIIYKHNKLEKEISPSFNIHAKVSEVEVKGTKETEETKKTEGISKTAPIVEKVIEKIVEQKPLVTTQNTSNTNYLKRMNIPLNDKFRFINELFKKNDEEYNVALQQLNSLNNWYESELYLNSLQDVYEWKETADTVKHFYSIAKKRFD